MECLECPLADDAIVSKSGSRSCSTTEREVMVLRLRNAIADKEWAIAAANRESMAYEAWQSDWYKVIAEAQEEIDWAIHQLGGNRKA